ncbi:MAG: hypothetical protein U1F37_02355 [Alphaproteobacteria bacterium]
MRVVRHLFVSLMIAALVAGGMPLSLALGCIPSAPAAAPAAAPCEHGGCDEPESSDTGCVCIHYPAPHAPGSLAVFEIPQPIVAPLALSDIEPAPPAFVPARADAPDPPPPRSGPQRA